MNKFLTKVTALCVGLAMVAGVGVAVGSKAVSEAKAAASLAATFTCGADGSASHNDGTSATTYSETKSGYTLSVTNGVKFYTGARDAKGNGCLKFGTSSAVGSMQFTAPSDVVLVKIYVAGYKANSAKISVNSGTVQTISTTSNNGQYTAVDVDTSSSKNVSFTTASGGVRAMINTIEFYTEGASTDHTVTDSVSDGTISPSSVADGGTLTATITPDTWYSVPTSVSVTMGGTAVAHTYSNGVVTVQNVTGDIEISGSCVKTGGPAHAGTLADPYTIADAYMAIDASKATTDVYVQGIVSEIKESWSSQYSNISFNVSADGETTGNQLEFFRCVSSTEHPIASDADIEVGATVIGFGSLTKHNSTYEYGAGCKVVSYTAPTSSPLSSISLSGTHATSFDVGDTFSYAGLVVTAHYEDTSSKTVTPTSVSAPDMSSAGQKTVTVTYTENEVSKSAQYTITVNAVTYYQISFLPGEGSGTHASVQAKEGSDYELPTSTTFTAPNGKVFDYWDFGGEKVTVIENVNDDYEVTAIWKDAPATTTLSAMFGTDKSNASAEVTDGAKYKTDYNYTIDSNLSFSDISKVYPQTSNALKFGSSSTVGSMTVKVDVENAVIVSVTINAYRHHATNGTTMTIGGIEKELTAEAADYVADVSSAASDSVVISALSSSSDKRFYIVSLTIEYSTSGTPVEKVLTGISVSGAKTDFKVGDTFVTTGLVVTGHYQDAADAVISSGFEIDSTLVNTAVAGDYTVTVSYGGFDDSYTVTYSEAAPTATYKKVKTDLADFSGDYLIVYEDGNVAFDGSLATLDAVSNKQDVAIDEEVIEVSSEYEFHIEAKEGGYSIQSASGKYIGSSTNSNELKTSDSDIYTSSITYSRNDSLMEIVCNSHYLRFNDASNQNRFRFFTNQNQKAISLYVKVANNAEALALDILNETSPICSAEHDSSSFASVWSSLGTKFEALGSEKSVLVEGDANANGTFVAEALARYDIIVGRYGLEGFITDRVASSSYIPVYESSIDASNSVTVIVIVAVTSMTLLGVTLVLRKRKHQ